jgi:hypothetical protein
MEVEILKLLEAKKRRNEKFGQPAGGSNQTTGH